MVSLQNKSDVQGQQNMKAKINITCKFQTGECDYLKCFVYVYLFIVNIDIGI